LARSTNASVFAIGRPIGTVAASGGTSRTSWQTAKVVVSVGP
jgi:hypothetical protein